MAVCLVLIAVSPEIYAWIVTADGVTFMRDSHTRQGKGKARGPFPGRLWILRNSCIEHISGFNKASACGFSLFLVINAFTYSFGSFLIAFMGNYPIIAQNPHLLCLPEWMIPSGFILHYELDSKGLYPYSKYTTASCNRDL